MKMDRIKVGYLVLLMALLAITLSACVPKVTMTPPLTPISMQLLWTHNASFAGFYAADQNGYYADEGLAVTFIEGGPTVDLIAPVLNGTAQFGDSSADMLLLARSEAKPVRAIATIDRRSAAAFVALSDSGITRPQDFVGKTIRTTPTLIATLHAMMANVDVRPDQYSEVTLPSDVASFSSGVAQVWGIYTNNFGVTLQQAGYKLNFIYPDDYGVHFYGDTIFTTDEFIAKNPDLVLRFLRATLKGYTYAIENPEAAAQMVSKYDPKADTQLETAKMFVKMLLVNTGEDHIGWMKPEVWVGMEQTLRVQGELTAPVEVTQVYTLQFLEEIYGK
jgi:NitT/TauT family transport system substrate-binding protein